MNPQSYAETHEVFNQVPPLDGANLYAIDLPLQEWLRRYQAGWAEERLHAYGALAGGPLLQAGFLANEHKPQFRTHDRYGQRRSPDTETIPLCYDHHQLLHADKRAWREAHGPDHGYLPEVLAAIGAEPSGER